MSEEKKDTKKPYQNLVLDKKETQVTITAEVPTELLGVQFEKALDHAVSEAVFDGFRKGHAPRDLVRARVGDSALLEDAAERLVSFAYASIVQDEDLDVVGRPSVRVTKLAQGNPVGFVVEVALYPKFALPEYKNIARDVLKKHPLENVHVSDDEVQEELKRLQKMLAGSLEHTHMHEDGEEHDHNHVHEEVQDLEKDAKKEEQKLPPIDDVFAQSVGNFQTLDDLKKVVREGMELSKKKKNRDARRLALVDALLEKTTIPLPELFVEGEIHSMRVSFEEQLERAGISFEQYCTREHKTKEDIERDWRPDAEKRARLQLLLNALAEQEKLVPDTDRFNREVAHIKEHYPDAHEENIRTFVTTNMVNDMVFTLLEKED
jgi:trigger factor